MYLSLLLQKDVSSSCKQGRKSSSHPRGHIKSYLLSHLSLPQEIAMRMGFLSRQEDTSEGLSLPKGQGLLHLKHSTSYNTGKSPDSWYGCKSLTRGLAINGFLEPSRRKSRALLRPPGWPPKLQLMCEL